MKYTNTIIDELLQQFKPVLINDFEKYRNHVYRVFINCTLLDKENGNEDKYATAAVFHDIAIWTDNTIDYLLPSIKQLEIFLNEKGKQDWLEEISAMIYWHHKTKKYTGKFQITVETFRQADWIDVSLGLLRYTSDMKKIKEVKHIFPNKGFHLFLVKKILKNSFRHPFNPLPMFKR